MGHGAAEKRPMPLMTVCRSITYTKARLEMEFHYLAWTPSDGDMLLCLDLSILTKVLLIYWTAFCAAAIR